MIPGPRFQGWAIEKDGGWTFELLVSIFGEEEGQLFVGDIIYSTRDEAIKYLKIAIQDAIKDLAECMPELGINKDMYIDIKTNSTRHWNNKSDH